MKNSDSGKTLSKKDRERFYSNWDNEDTKKEFFNYNIRLVHYIAKRYVSTGIDYDDLFQTASIGLWKAITTFDPKKGFQFATYATRVMNNEILMLLRQSKKWPLVDDKKIVSMDSFLNIDQDGNTLTFEDILVSSELEIDDDLLGTELDKLISDFLSNYNERNAYIVKLHRDGKTQRIIAQQMNLSQSYVSRIIKQFKRDLKKYLRNHWNDEIQL